MPALHESSRTIHQHPPAYLLGLEGVALMRAFAGEYDRAFTEARLHEIRDLLAPMLDRLRPGRALDAACGTGAVAQQLVARGHEVIGVDLSEVLLDRARQVVPEATFLTGNLTDLPLPDEDVDHVVCSLALTHLADLAPFFTEAARVMRPGGHLLLLDTRGHYTGSGRYPLARGARHPAERQVLFSNMCSSRIAP